jgi:fatty-acyl-CoA synthase
VVGLNPTRRGAHLADDVRRTDCSLILTDREHRDLLDGLDLGLPRERVIEVDDPAFLDALPDDPEWRAEVPPSPEDLWVLLFTSGSSGTPKAVRMTQGRATRASDSLICARDDVPYLAMPLFHGNALNACLLPALRVGATIVLRRRFSATAFIDDVRTQGCTYFSAIGRVLSYVLETPPRPDDRDNSLKLVLGPETSAADMAAFEERFGCPVFAGYGSSENAIILYPPPRDTPGALGTAPRGDEIAVVDPDTLEVRPVARFDEAGRLLNAEEAIGELVGRNALDRFEGYYGDPESERERCHDGWYWSGDLAYRDADGVFWFAGRTADWIRVDGENFATAPIERILRRFEGVRNVAVYGVPDERNAEDQVMAALEMEDGATFDPAAFAAFLAAQADLGTKWAPRYVRVAERLPVTGTDKTDKKPLRSDAWRAEDPVWWHPDRRRPEYVALTPEDAASLDDALARNRRAVGT